MMWLPLFSDLYAFSHNIIFKCSKILSVKLQRELMKFYVVFIASEFTTNWHNRCLCCCSGCCHHNVLFWIHCLCRITPDKNLVEWELKVVLLWIISHRCLLGTFLSSVTFSGFSFCIKLVLHPCPCASWWMVILLIHFVMSIEGLAWQCCN